MDDEDILKLGDFEGEAPPELAQGYRDLLQADEQRKQIREVWDTINN